MQLDICGTSPETEHLVRETGGCIGDLRIAYKSDLKGEEKKEKDLPISRKHHELKSLDGTIYRGLHCQ